MGGSLGLALKARGGLRVAACARRAETLRRALERGVADETFDQPAAAADGASVVVVCAPVLAIPDLVRQCREGLRPGGVVTDVGSTKAWVQREAAAAVEGTGALFVGSHPMAGSEKTGLESASAGLYAGALTVVTPGDAPAAAVRAVRGLWEAAGCRVLEMDAGEHDLCVARTSHMPHVTAALVVLAAAAGTPPEWRPRLGALAGPGFRDTTRVAAGSPAMWRDILCTNGGAILSALADLGRGIEALAEAVRTERFDEVYRMLDDARHVRSGLMDRSPFGPDADKGRGSA